MFSWIKKPASLGVAIRVLGAYTLLVELADDVQGAANSGKRLAIMWELRGCPYCKETHLVNFAKPEIESYIKQHFEVLQLNILGSREVTDFDGEKMSEKRLAAKYGVRFTPRELGSARTLGDVLDLVRERQGRA